MLNGISASNHPQGALLVTGYWLDFIPFVMILWANFSAHFTVHLFISHKLDYKDATGNGVKGIAVVKV